ncbi:sensor histidine kinase [Streptomyces hawaiiensis]|uniref:sensor histidine kinase n=1 Tax=Streptomyces hawaiiensis TaxID=67305 RepID=UPI00365BC70B
MNQHEHPGALALCADTATRLDRQLLRPPAGEVGPPPVAPPPDEAPRGVRQNLAGVREEECRRLRRDLHDGLGPHLAAVQMRLDAAQACSAPTSAAAEHLRIAAEALGEALIEVRRITAGTRPATLMKRGLLDATRDLAHRLCTRDVQVVVVGPHRPLPPLASTVETTAYRITAEALTNAVRHSRARRVHVGFSVDFPTLTVSVTDDGTGLDARAVAGTGLASVAARAAEIGGLATLGTGPHGTEVRVALPLTCARTHKDDHE